MQPYPGMERRTSQRVPLTTSCLTSFAHHGVLFSGVMLDLSEKGARFRLNENAGVCSFEKNEEIAFEISTPYGLSLCRGKVAWTTQQDEFFEWGIEFTGLSEKAKDPLRCLMDSEF
jgi:hypothetical protein